MERRTDMTSHSNAATGNAVFPGKLIDYFEYEWTV